MTLNNLFAPEGDSKGQINLQWNSVENAVSYIIEIAYSEHSKDVRWKISQNYSNCVKRQRSNISLKMKSSQTEVMKLISRK